ncbi:hypothetical protein F4Z99_09065 [Candidatus Poribacteria bacterium]|nr:hypothetical protein [Candidatus Poribacteria bacterium]MYA99495.1 hypothetical protein [Candidatus Poribacteria bacterium]
MSITFNPFKRRSIYLLIFGALFLLLIVVVVRVLSPSPPDLEPVKERTAVSEPRRVHRTPPRVFEVSENYYQTIIDNNLFRPLGWRPPRPREPYRLIGTKLARDANTPPQAIIESTAGNTTYIVSIGEKIDASTEVVDIQPKQVTLSTNGAQRKLRLNTAVTLNASAATRRFPIRTTHTPTPMRRPPGVSAPRTDSPPSPRRPLSDWETREGQPIPIGDARLKNPQKWGLRRR